MKNLKILSTSIIAALSMSVHAQTWGTSTYTTSHVGISAASYPNDAKLKIFGDVSVPAENIPELSIDRMGTNMSPANIFELRIAGSLVNVINAQGYVGINKPNPASRLHVGGNATIDGYLAAGTLNATNIFLSGSITTPFVFTDEINASLSASFGGMINMGGNISMGGHISMTGDVIMGGVTIPPGGGYMLYVGQGILTEKLKVANSTDAMNWSDFVFNKDYKLRSLYDVESYINSNKHLPEIPSAKEVAADGIDVASMDAKLLQKIEELTLYVIQQQKEIDELKKQRKH